MGGVKLHMCVSFGNVALLNNIFPNTNFIKSIVQLKFYISYINSIFLVKHFDMLLMKPNKTNVRHAFIKRR
jgi:hypothetical protein